MRAWGRVNGVWTEVVTDPVTGLNDAVWLTTLLRVLKLNLGEDPFHTDYGIPAQQSVQQQIFPDFYAIQMIQQQFSQYFASLSVARISDNPPTYNINVIMNNGTKFQTTIAS